MCFIMPGKIVEIKDDVARIDYGNDVFREGNCSLVECNIGDYVMLQAGFIIEIIEAQRAERLIKMIDEENLQFEF